jgi:hypothetical protein
MGVGQVHITQLQLSGPLQPVGPTETPPGRCGDTDCAHSWTDAPPWNMDQYLAHG